MRKMTRILFASDFHGSDMFFRKFIRAAYNYKAQVLIGGGDIAGKAMIPIIHKGNGVYEGYLFGSKHVAETSKELEKFKQSISNTGFYPIVLEPDEAKDLETNKEKMDKKFNEMMINRLKEWMELAEEHLSKKGIKFFFMPGNDDPYVIDEIINNSNFVINHDGKKVWIDENHEMVGLAYANITPWHCERDIPEEELNKKIEDVVAKIENMQNAIFSFHCPPYDTLIDQAPEIDENLKIKTKGGQVVMKHVGCKSIRDAIEKCQPLLSLHGHIHEAAGFDKIGRTIIANPGSEYAEGILKAVLVNLGKSEVIGRMIISG